LGLLGCQADGFTDLKILTTLHLTRGEGAFTMATSLRITSYLVMLRARKFFDVTMPKSSKKARKSWFTGNRKKVIIIGGVIVLLVAAAGAGLLLRFVLSNGKPADTNDRPANSNRDSFSPSVTNAQDLMVTGKSNEASKQLESDIAGTDNSDEKYELYLTQGVNYENQKQYDNAIAAYKNAEAIKKTSTVYESLGRTLAAKGDKAAAIEYYKQAIPLLDKNSPRHDAEQYELEQIIKGLGG